MSDYSEQVEKIKNAKSLSDIHAAVNQFSAKAQGDGGVLYSRWVGRVESQAIAIEVAKRTGLQIIDDSPRAKFLNENFETIRDEATRIFIETGKDSSRANELAIDFLFGDEKAPPDSPTSIQNSLWGRASDEFSRSLRGPVVLVASQANAERVFGTVELGNVVHNADVPTLAGIDVSELRARHAAGGTQAVLPKVQAAFIRAADEGIFYVPPKAGDQPAHVIISREFAQAMGVDPHRLLAAHELHNAGLPLAPTELGKVRPQWAAMQPEWVTQPRIPGLDRAAGVGAVAGLGAAASIYDARRTAERVGTLLAQDNPLAARSELQHFAARGMGGWVGGTLTAGLVGTSSATGIGLVVADAYLLSLAAERGADWLDHRSIVRQSDRDGVQWHYTGHAWQREARADLSADGADNPQPVTVAASIEKDRELNYQASAAAAALAIRQTSLQDPGVLPAGETDTPSLQRAHWQRNAGTGQWQREVVTAFAERGMSATLVETATPQRAAQLDAQAAQVMAANLANGPAAIAARFEAAYRGNGWRDFGPLPDAVQTALHPDRLQASDDRQYQRDADGTWQHEGERANSNRAWELERTRDALLPALAQHRQAIEQIPAYAAPTGAALREAHLQYMYRQHGTDLRDDWRQAIAAAIEQTRQANGLTESGAMQLLPNADGRIAADSGITHLRKDASGVQQVVARTTSEEIVAAWRALKAQQRDVAVYDQAPSHAARATTVAPADAIARMPPMTVMPEKDRGKDRQEEDSPSAHAEAAATTVRRGFPPAHPDAPLRQAIGKLLPPETTEERLLELTVAARTAGIRADTFKGITVHPADEMKLVLHGTIPGFQTTVDLKQPQVAQAESMQRLDAYHEQQAERLAQFQQQQERANAWERLHGPGPGGPSAPGLGM